MIGPGATRQRADAQFTELVQLNSPKLLAYFVRRVETAGDAADLLSETFIVAWRRRNELPADSTEQLMWLYRVASYVLTNHHRSRRRSQRLIEELRSVLNEHLDDHTGETDLRVTVQQALRKLEPAGAEIIRLVHWDGLTIAEAANVVGLTASGARSRYATARAHLRAHLGASEDGAASGPTSADFRIASPVATGDGER